MPLVKVIIFEVEQWLSNIYRPNIGELLYKEVPAPPISNSDLRTIVLDPESEFHQCSL